MASGDLQIEVQIPSNGRLRPRLALDFKLQRPRRPLCDACTPYSTHVILDDNMVRGVTFLWQRIEKGHNWWVHFHLTLECRCPRSVTRPVTRMFYSQSPQRVRSSTMRPSEIRTHLLIQSHVEPSRPPKLFSISRA